MFNYRLINNNGDVEGAFLSENMEQLAKDLNCVRNLLVTAKHPLSKDEERMMSFLTLVLCELQVRMREQDNAINSTTNSTSPRI